MRFIKYLFKPPSLDNDDRRNVDDMQGLVFWPILLVVWYFELWPSSYWFWNVVAIWCFALALNISINTFLWRDELPKSSDKPSGVENRLLSQLKNYDWVPSIVAGVIASLIAAGLQIALQ